MIITNQRNIIKNDIYIYGQAIEWVTSYKYLGVTIDNKLTWNPHLLNVSKKANIVMSQCRKMISKSWGLNPTICKWLYTALIRPILSYGCLVWLKAITQPSKLTILRKVQRKACLSTMNAMTSTPTASMEVMMNILPIDIHIETVAINSYLRMVRNENWKVQPGEINNKMAHANLIMKLCNNINDIYLPIDNLRYKQYIKSRFKVQIFSKEELEQKEIKFTPDEINVIHCFTDGSKIEDKSGCGFIYRNKLFKDQGYRGLGKHTTVFQCEITAIDDAITHMIDKNVKGKKIHIYIDSQAAIKSLDNYIVTNRTVANCKEKINMLSQENRITLHWIKAHVGYSGNEIADRLAKRGTNENINEENEPIIPVSAQVIKRKINVWAEVKHKVRWKSKTKHILETFDYKHTKIFIKEPTPNIWKVLKKLSRQEIRIITGLITGHNTLQKHLVKMKLADFDSPYCEQCLEDAEETTLHFVGQCIKYCTTRYEVFGKHFLDERDLRNAKISQILRFVKASKRLE